MPAMRRHKQLEAPDTHACRDPSCEALIEIQNRPATDAVPKRIIKPGEKNTQGMINTFGNSTKKAVRKTRVQAT
jgi:hypothetical protein